MQIEEGSADMFRAVAKINSGNLIPYLYPGVFCEGMPSDVHPHQSELAKCLFLSEPKMGELAQKKLNCRVKK